MIFDAIIVGGGPAGLNAAIVLGRSRRNVVLFDTGRQRNRFSHGIHNYLTRDNILPADFLKIAYKEIRRYGTTVNHVEIVHAEKLESGIFFVKDKHGKKYHAKKLLLATGLRDNIPPLEGIIDFYGTSVFHYPYCDGWEVSNKSIGVYAKNKNGFELALSLLTWSSKVTLYMDGKAYLKAAIDAGLDINVFARRISFFFNAHNNFFEEIAKFRAARRMWAHITKGLGATDERAMMLRFHTQTGGATLTAQQPLNNITRVTIQTLAAVLGGTQSLHTNGYDEALSLPTEEAARIALRTQQIVAYESGAPDTVDPLAGSYFIESLTKEVETEAQKLIEKIDAMGGSVSAIEQGFIQNEIAKSAYEYQRGIESGEKIIVGLNKFQTNEEGSIPLLKVDDSIRQVQADKLKKLKNNRDNAKIDQLLQILSDKANGTENIMPAVLEAVENKCTLGEIADTLREVFGEHK